MIFTHHFVSALGPALLCASVTQAYSLTDKYVGHDFLAGWRWETLDDPTHGRVNYIDRASALQSNLSFASDTQLVLRVDDANVVPPGARGRDSVRIISEKAWSESLVIMDLSHMPEGCATWPAFWTLSAAGPWPRGGEIDIVEGVNLNTDNLSSLHTSLNCTMPASRAQSGRSVSSDCDAAKNSNQGCGTSFETPNSYGAGFNAQGGGWFVMERSRNKGISVWFYSRTNQDVPPPIMDCSETLVPDISWGEPQAYFPLNTCDYNSHFDAHNFIIDTTLCGDWGAGAFWAAGCGSQKCDDYVDTHPEKFSDAYWEINSLRIYTPDL